MLIDQLKQLIIASLLFVLPAVSTAKQEFKSTPKQTQLIELYSSQGCSSCPPAQAFINTFKNHEKLWQDIIPVVFHVDYWDYLGWKDPYSSAEYSARQNAFAAKGLVKSVYTPGFVVDGKEWRGYFLRTPLPEQNKTPGVLTVIKDNQFLSVQFDGEVTQNTRVNIALLGFDVITKIQSGENAKRHLPEEFIVLGFESHPFIDEQQKATDLQQFTLPKSTIAPPKAIAVWLTKDNDLEPIQATGGYLQ